MPRIRVLQTSDLHLRPDCPERLATLDQIFATATAHAADMVIVAGDLFDRSSDAIALRQEVRKRIEAIAPLPVVLLPGNHDQAAFGPETDYGTNAVVLRETPWQKTTVCGLDVVGVPYQTGRTLAECLVGTTMDPHHTILVGHGSLMSGVGDAFVGEGEEGAWMPIFLADILGRCCYGALGHVHSGRNLVHRDGERLVGYAGSPLTTSRRELGRRGVLLVDFEAAAGVVAHEFVPLPTPYYERVEVVCVPGMEKKAVRELARLAAELRGPGAQVLACLSGIVTENEDKLHQAATRALEIAFADPRGEDVAGAEMGEDTLKSRPIFTLEARSFRHLANVPVVAEFVERVQLQIEDGRESDPEVIQSALRLGLGAFLEALR
ncbi:MAG: metallophosphoesterase [Deltaproteobacteria bacterium]